MIERIKMTDKEAIKIKHNPKEMFERVEETSNLLISLITEILVSKNDSNKNLM